MRSGYEWKGSGMSKGFGGRGGEGAAGGGGEFGGGVGGLKPSASNDQI